MDYKIFTDGAKVYLLGCKLLKESKRAREQESKRAREQESKKNRYIGEKFLGHNKGGGESEIYIQKI